jgi:hypothetical protein
MILVDLVPILATFGTLASGAVGAYFERSRKNLQDEEPQGIETAAIAAIEREEAGQAAVVAPVSGTNVIPPGISAEDLAAAVGRSVRAELKAANERAERASMKVNAAFFVTGILASVAVTLFIHPLH